MAARSGSSGGTAPGSVELPEIGWFGSMNEDEDGDRMGQEWVSERGNSGAEPGNPPIVTGHTRP